MKILNLRLMGRAGNTLFQWAFAKGFSDRNNMELRNDPWWGEKVFQIDGKRIQERLPLANESQMVDGMDSCEFQGYAQMQKCADYYTRTQCKQWFQFRPEIEAVLRARIQNEPPAVYHYRAGDFSGNAYYPVLLHSCYTRQFRKMGISNYSCVSEENSVTTDHLPADISFIVDFWRLMRAKVLLRANSSFSYWAGVLGNAEVWSPRIDGVKGGVTHDDVQWECGNHCRLADIDFITDLEVKP